MDSAALSALRDWKPNQHIPHLKLCNSPDAAPQLQSDNAGPGTFTARATFELPDGGRFCLLLSGSTDRTQTDGASSPSSGDLMALVEDRLGLPDGFLIDMNTHLLTNICADDRRWTPSALVNATLKHANMLFNKAFQQTKQPAEPVTPPPSLKRKRNTPEQYEAPIFGSSPLATTTLMKQIKLLSTMDTRKDGFTAEPAADDLYKWNVQLYFDDSSRIGQDLANVARTDAVHLEFRFPSAYPSVPPIVRVVTPYVSGGHVMAHGAICMELLAGSGWAPVNSLDVVCIQIRAVLIQGQARIDPARCSNIRNYTFEGAMRDLRRIVTSHRWSAENGRVLKRPERP